MVNGFYLPRQDIQVIADTLGLQVIQVYLGIVAIPELVDTLAIADYQVTVATLENPDIVVTQALVVIVGTPENQDTLGTLV